MKTSTCIIALVLWIPIALALLTVKPQRTVQELGVAESAVNDADPNDEGVLYLPPDQTIPPDENRASGG